MLSSLGIGSALSELIAGGWKGAGMTDMQFAMLLGSIGSRAQLKSVLGSGNSGLGGFPSWAGFTVPGLRTGGTLLSDGLVFGHRNETMMPAKVAPLPSSIGANNTIEVTSHNVITLDGRVLAKQITKEKKFQQKLMTGSPNGRRWERVN